MHHHVGRLERFLVRRALLRIVSAVDLAVHLTEMEVRPLIYIGQVDVVELVLNVIDLLTQRRIS